MLVLSDSLLPQHKQHLKKIKEMSLQCQEIVHLGVKNPSNDHFEQNSKRKHEPTLRPNKSCHNAMTEVEASTIYDVWSIGLNERWRLYNYWLSCYCEERAQYVSRISTRYNQLANQLAELYREQDYDILREASVVGMTTTGAAKYRSLIQRVQPRIVVVEEAAEVLESHVVATLSKRYMD